MTIEKLNAEFEEILKGTINPFFKRFKFRKKAQNFARISNDITQTFSIQKNFVTTSIDKLYFSFSFGFFNQDIHNIALNQDIEFEFPTTTDSFIQNPLGLYSHKREHWYELSSRIDAQKTALNVKADLDNYVKPLFNTYKSLDDLVRFTEIYEGNKLLKSPYEYIAFLMLTNQKDKGELMIRNYYRKALALKGPVNVDQFPYRKIEATTSVSNSKKQYLDSLRQLAIRFNVRLEVSQNIGK